MNITDHRSERSEDRLGRPVGGSAPPSVKHGGAGGAGSGSGSGSGSAGSSAGSGTGSGTGGGATVISPAFFANMDTAAVRLSGLICGIDKSLWAISDPDPVETLLSAAVKTAPREFWPVLSRSDIKSMVARVRNWLLAMIRAKRKDQTGAGLRLLAQLDLSPEILGQIKLQPVLRVLRKSAVGADACALAARHDLNLDAPPSQSQSQSPAASVSATGKRAQSGGASSPPQTKLRSELAIPKRQARSTQNFASLMLLNKRSRDEPTEVTAAAEPPKKHRKSRKVVQWREDDELLRVKYFSPENSPMTMSSEYVEAHGVHGAQWGSQWGPDAGAGPSVPGETEFDTYTFKLTIPANLLSQTGSKRGGTLVAPAPPSQPGMPFSLGASPAEPTDVPAAATAPAPTQIPKFEPARPSSHNVHTFLSTH